MGRKVRVMVGTALGPVDGVSDGSVVRIGNVVATREGNVESIVEGTILAVPLGLTLGIVVAKVGTSDGCELGSLDGSVPGLTEDGKLLGLVVGSLLRATLVTVEGLELGIPLGTSEVALGL